MGVRLGVNEGITGGRQGSIQQIEGRRQGKDPQFPWVTDEIRGGGGELD